MAGLNEMARDVGQAIARTDEYKALMKATERADEDREIVEHRNRLVKLEETLRTAMQRGEEPDEELVEEYEKVAGELQGSPVYQSLVAAQSNFDKVIEKVNQEISQGIQEGSESRIVLPS